MATTYNPRIVTDGLILCLDAGNTKSYPGSGTTWKDLSGNGNNGTLTNGPTFSSANKGSIVFDGTNDFVNCGQGLALGGSWTISGWCKPTAFSGAKIILSRSGDAPSYLQNYSLYLNNNKFRIASSANSYRAAESTTTAVSGSVYFVTGVYNAGTQILSIYVNGVFESSATALTEAPPTTGVQYVQIGANDSIISPANRFVGSIAYASIYNRALSAAEIQQNFNAIRGRFESAVSWNYANNAALTQGKTTDVVSFTIASNVSSFSSSGTLPTGTSLSLNGETLTLSGTLAQFGYAAASIAENASYTLRAADFGVTRTFTITANRETRTFTHRQVGNLLISKTFESYGTPNNVNFVSLAAQQNDATTNPSFTTGGCAAVGQVLSGGGVASVNMNANNSTYGDPCVGTLKKLNVSYTI